MFVPPSRPHDTETLKNMAKAVMWQNLNTMHMANKVLFNPEYEFRDDINYDIEYESHLNKCVHESKNQLKLLSTALRDLNTGEQEIIQPTLPSIDWNK